MVRKTLLILGMLLGLMPSMVGAQSVYSGTLDFSGATVRLPNGTSNPATCTVSDIFVNTTTGAIPRLCTAVNTWTNLLQGSLGSTDNAIARVSGTGGSTLDGGSVEPPTYNDAGTLQLNTTSSASAPKLKFGPSGSFFWGDTVNLTWNEGGGTAAENNIMFFGNLEGLALASDNLLVWTSTTNVSAGGQDTGFERAAAGVVRVTNASTGLGYLIGGVVIEANTGTKSPNAATESGECYTNTGDADGSTINLPNDPTVGARVCVNLTENVSVTVAPGAGETLKVNGVSYSTSCIANTEGAKIEFTASVGGAGGEWTAGSVQGIWTCDGVRANNDSARSLQVVSSGSGTPTIFEVPALAYTASDVIVIGGEGSGGAITTGGNHIVIGDNSFEKETNHAGSIVIGHGSGNGILAERSVVLGNSSGGITTAYSLSDYNTIIGNWTMPYGGGAYNVALGHGIQVINATGFTGNVFIGALSGGQGGLSQDQDYQIAIGYDAGATDSYDDCLAMGRASACSASNTANFGSTTGHYASTTTTRSATGSADVQALNTEQITLSTGGTTTNSSGNIVPAGSIIDAIACRVTTTITTATEWGVSITGDAAWNQIGTTDTTVGTMTAGTTAIFVAPAHDGQYNDTATTITITTTGTPGAGAIRCAVHSRTFTPPTS